MFLEHLIYDVLCSGPFASFTIFFFIYFLWCNPVCSTFVLNTKEIIYHLVYMLPLSVQNFWIHIVHENRYVVNLFLMLFVFSRFLATVRSTCNSVKQMSRYVVNLFLHTSHPKEKSSIFCLGSSLFHQSNWSIGMLKLVSGIRILYL